MAGTITKGLIGKQDESLWDGTDVMTYTRTTSSGYALTLNKMVGFGVDVCAVYGGGSVRTTAVLDLAIAAIGSPTVTVPLYLSRGTWTIDKSIVIPSGYQVVPAVGAIIDADKPICDSGTAWTWTVHAGSVYKLDQTINEPTHVYESGTRLTEVANAAAVTSAGKWAWEGSKLYIRTSGSVDPDSLTSGAIQASYSFDIQGSFVADKTQVFTTYSTILFGQGSCDFLLPEWWGAKGDATGQTTVGTDSTAFVKACLVTAVTSTIPVYVPATALYRITSEIDLTSPPSSRLVITGERLRSTINATENYKVKGGFFKDFESATGESMLIIGGTATGATTRAYGVNITGVNFTGSEDRIDDNGQLIKLRFCSEASICDTNFSEYKGTALLIQNSWDVTLRDVRSIRCGDTSNSRFSFEIVDTADGASQSNHAHFINVRSEGSPHGELKIVGQSTSYAINDIYFIGCKFHSPTTHTGPGIYMEKVEKIFWSVGGVINSKNKGIHIKNGDKVFFDNLKIQGVHDEQIYVEGESHVYVTSGYIAGPTDVANHVSSTVSSDGTSTFTDAAAGFVAAGVTAAMIIRVTGFTDDANNGYFSLASVGVTTLVVDQTSLAVEAVGDAVTIQFFLPHFAVVDATSNLYIGPYVECYQFYENVDGGMVPPYSGSGEFRYFHVNENGLQMINHRVQVSRESSSAGYFAGRDLDANSGAVDGHDRVRLTRTKLEWGDGSVEPDATMERYAAGVLGPDVSTDWRIPGFHATTPSYLIINNQATDYYLWVDNGGRLRILNSRPAAVTDGTAVGDQTGP